MAEVIERESTRAFPAGPRVGCYFPSEAAERARTTLTRCIERMEGPALLIGASGSGKSLMLGVLTEYFRYRLSVAVLTGGLLRTPRELHQGVLYALGLPFKGMDEGELRLTLVQRLESDDDAQEGVLLLVDEAQLLTPELIEELRLLTNVVRDGASSVRLVLAGTPELEELLADVRLTSFQQRIAVRSYLAELSRAETKAYIRSHLTAANQDAEFFTPDALDQVHEATEGMPRQVNQLCDHVLLLVRAEGLSRIDDRLVDEAWRDLQQLPDLSSPDEEADCSENVLEFGILDGRPEPSERLDAIADQLSLLDGDAADATARRHGRADSQPRGNSDSSAGIEVDFSLPDEEWPEVEVVLPDAPLDSTDEFSEEEVIADPFPRLPAARAGRWSPAHAADRSRSEAAVRLPAADQVLEACQQTPLQSVPLMVHVQTDLYEPDPVWPEEPVTSFPAVLSDELLPSVEVSAADDRNTAAPRLDDGCADPAQSDVPAKPFPRSHMAPKRKQFATLFSSLKD